MRYPNLVLGTLLLLSAACGTTGCSAPDYGRPLPEGADALLRVEDPADWPDFEGQWYERAELLPPLERSIDWTKRDYAKSFYPQAGIEHARALASLERFRDILISSDNANQFRRAIESEFDVYMSAGWDGKGGGVLYTGYYTPIFPGSLTRGGVYQYPLYALPPDLVKGPEGEILGRQTALGVQPYPERRTIEATHMLADAGLELVWLTNPLDAYIAHVNGSAFVELPSGELARFGYAGKNGQPYSSLGKALIEAGEVDKTGVSLQVIRAWAAKNDPAKVEQFLDLNAAYVFFTPIDGTPRGSLNVEVEPQRTLATDKSLFPRGALVFVDTRLPHPDGGEQLFERFMFDQDTGGAIRTAGRGDIYLGIGPEAEEVAGRTKAEGQLYYLFLKERVPALISATRPN